MNVKNRRRQDRSQEGRSRRVRLPVEFDTFGRPNMTTLVLQLRLFYGTKALSKAAAKQFSTYRILVFNRPKQIPRTLDLVHVGSLKMPKFCRPPDCRLHILKMLHSGFWGTLNHDSGIPQFSCTLHDRN
jgi:hypothetical protein